MSTPAPRLPGLDTLRAAAVALVVVYHYACFIDGAPPLGWAGSTGWVGVDLFFVLSGLLIAGPLLSGLARGRRLSVGRFFARRALRTLPVFWVVLTAFALAPAGTLGAGTLPPLWRMLSFTQNIGLRPGTAFSHAWSLCVEEQFYLVLPVVLVLGVRLRAGHRVGWAAWGALLALGVAARALAWWRLASVSHGAGAAYMTAVYYATPCRFDEFLPGIGLAMLRYGHGAAWDRAMRHGPWLLGAGAAAVAAMGAVAARDWITRVDDPFFMTVFGYSLLAGAFALLVAAAMSPGAWISRVRVPGASALARWSYSLYLSHRPVAWAVAGWLGAHGVRGWPAFLVVNLACLGVAALLHRLVEAPFLAWRDRVVPDSFVPAAAAAPVTMGAAAA